MKQSHNLIFIIILLLMLIFVGFLLSRKKAAAPSQPQNMPGYQIESRTKEYGCQVNGPYPDKDCTPGAVFPDATVDQICVRGYARSVRNVPYEEKKQAYEEYDIHHHYRGEYEVDHLISLELGGS